ncbi:MAG: hypothetical protein WCW65_01770 [Candidatus Paceibacterota bacterium]
MKKLVAILFLLLIAMPYSSFSQQENKGKEETFTVKESDLSPDVLQRLKDQKKLSNIKQDMDSIKKITGVGKEIGIAINDGLAAITDNATKFSQTPAGRFTMFLIAWKVMAKDVPNITGMVVGIIFGIPFVIFFNLFMLWFFRRTTNKRRYLKSVDKDGKKEWELVDTWYTEENESEGATQTRLAYVICWWVILGIGNLWIIAGVIF